MHEEVESKEDSMDSPRNGKGRKISV